MSSNGLIVAKFGGTSVVSANRINTICDIVKSQINKKVIVVVSAVSRVTDLLLSSANSSKKVAQKNLKEIEKIHLEIIQNLFVKKELQAEAIRYIKDSLTKIGNLLEKEKRDKEGLDKLVSFGEIMSSFVVALALKEAGVGSKQIIATDVIVTNNEFTNSEFLPKETKQKTVRVLKPLLQKGIVPVVTGFIGATKNGKTTTLGRGGSDYTASILGFCLSASEIQIWTDVDGIYTADPRFVKKAKLLSTVSYREASEMAWFGARVLHPRTMRPAIKGNIPLRVLNTFNPKAPGTLIIDKPDFSHPITAISCKKKITMVNIYSTEMLLSKGFFARIFAIFAKHDISVDLVGASEVSVSITLDNDENLSSAVKELSIFTQVNFTKDLGIVSIIGEGIITSSHAIKDIFSLLHNEKILVRMVSLGAADINLSLVVGLEHVDQAVRVLHDRLLLKRMVG